MFRTYGLTDEEIAPVLRVFEAKPKAWVDFMMKFELGLDEPNPKRALTSALTIAFAYMAGGLVPLSPYFFVRSSQEGLLPSVAMTLVAPAVFGYVKGRFTGAGPWKSAGQTVLVGGIAAAAALTRQGPVA